ncbi:MAB_1171c family putative transporter [Kitasatospora sp. MAP5-34]|uniref:MAB_1171c family putative transporter n=1 Tax=Kitasatospora sp. MAP5-34 TaxID=3035102 RepID=UPI00247347DE|nr:MAB_1171c family putative transporter [Kitasatospora sp. MAP5-34]MDH6575837.1 hypothetical protein [Kitasatospora sp. MAP5-34]
MIDAAGLLTCAVAVAGALCRLWLGRGVRTGRGAEFLVGFAVCIGASAVFLAPVSASAGEPWIPLWRVFPLLGMECRLAAECFLALMAYAVQAADNASARMRRQTVWSVLVMAVDVALYFAMTVSPTGDVLAVGVGGRVALAVFDTVFVAHSFWCVGLFTVVIHRSVRHVGAGLLRVGLRLVVAGGVAGLVWTALSFVPIGEGLATGRQYSAEDVFSAPAAVLTMTLGIGGATLTAWGRYATAPVRWLRAWRSYRRIGPLWSALYAVRPEIALQSSAAWWGLGGVGRNAEFALYRRVIEIRDGQLALRPYVHPRAAEWAGASCGDSDGRQCSAAAEAAAIAAALEAAVVDHRFSGNEHRVPEVGADLEAEAGWLVLVTEAFTGSAAVADVRRRVRAELGL